MGSIVFLPGILGSRLFLHGEEVWPPTAVEAALGYGRIDKLTDADVTPGDPIDAVACFDVYGPLLADLEDIASGNAGAPRRTLHAFGYDWRKNIEDTAEWIVAKIDGLPDGDRNEIRFVGHSMGCLVVRLILESPKYRARPWLAAVKSFTALAGPHQGAPTALVRAVGLEGSVGMSGPDIKRMAADPRYPSLYQLLPAPGTAAVLDGRGNRMRELDFYSEPVAGRLGLAVGNLAIARATHALLAANDRLDHIEYVYLAGSGNDTWLRIDLIGPDMRPRKGKDAGDGTVPLWSAVDPSRVHHAAPAAHDKVFENDQLRSLLYFSLGAKPRAVAFVSRDQKPLAAVVPTHPVYAAGKFVDLSFVPVVPAERIDGELIVEFSAIDQSVPEFRLLTTRPLIYEGVPIERLSLSLDRLPGIGFYRVGFRGSHDLSERGAAVFGVSDAGGATGG